MIQKFEITDKNNRYITCRYDTEKNILIVTTYLYPDKNVSIEETFEKCGFTIISKKNIENPKIITLTKGTDNEKSV